MKGRVLTGALLARITFSVDAGYSGGSFAWTSNKVSFAATTIDHFTLTGTQVTFDGAGTWNGLPGYTYQVTFADNGTPGKKDSMSLTVYSPLGLVAFTTGAALNLAAGSGDVLVI